MSKKLFGKVFIFLLVVGLLFAVAPKQAQAQTVSTWDGTYPTEKPLDMPAVVDGVQEVTTAAQFAWLSKQTTMFPSGTTTVKLMTDIDLLNFSWDPSLAIKGNPSNIFDGNGHTIKNLKVEFTDLSSAYVYGALFYNPSAGVPLIKDLTVDGATVNPTIGATNRSYVAVVAAGMDWNGSFDNVTVKNATVTGTKYVAAIVSYTSNYSEHYINNCTVQNVILNVNEQLKSDGTRTLPHAGALAGLDNAGTVSRNTVSGLTINLTAPAGYEVDSTQIGGLIGTAQAEVLVGANSVSDVTLNGAPYTKLIGLDNRTYKVVNATQMLGYTTIQDAVAESAAGDVINVAAGTYDIGTLVIPHPLSIIGAGDTTLVNGKFQLTNAGSVAGTYLFQTMKFPVTNSSITVTDFGHVIDEVKVDNVTFDTNLDKSARAIGVGVDSVDYGIKKFTVLNSRFYSTLAIYLDGDIGAVEITGNEFHVTDIHWGAYNAINLNQSVPASASIDPTGTYIIQNNLFFVPGTAYSSAGAVTNQAYPGSAFAGKPGGKELTETGNTLKVGDGAPITDQSLFIKDSIAVANATLKVHNVTQDKWYTTIQAAIEAAVDLDLIEVGPGTYVETVTVNKDITLDGATDPFGSTPAVVQGLITISAQGATVQDLKVTPGSVVGQVAAVSVSASNTTVSGNLIDGMVGDNTATIKGIHVYGGSTTALQTITISGNTVKNISNPGTLVKGTDGIQIQGNLIGVNVSNNIISAISSQGWAFGIEVTPSGANPTLPPQDVVITENTISNISAVTYPGIALSVDQYNDANTADASKVIAELNRFNAMPVVNKDGLHSLLAEKNWWGTSAGPQPSMMYGTMDASPWCTNPECTLFAEAPVVTIAAVSPVVCGNTTTTTIDINVAGIPEATPLQGYQFRLNFDETKTNVANLATDIVNGGFILNDGYLVATWIDETTGAISTTPTGILDIGYSQWTPSASFGDGKLASIKLTHAGVPGDIELLLSDVVLSDRDAYVIPSEFFATATTLTLEPAVLNTTQGLGYCTLADAVAGAAAEDNLELQADITIPAMVTVEKTLTLDLNGKVATYSTIDLSYAITVDGTSAALTVKDTSTEGTGKILVVDADEDGNTDGRGIGVISGSLTLASGTIQAPYAGVYIRPGASMVMDGGTIGGTVDPLYGITVLGTGSSLDINGGAVEATYFAVTGNGTAGFGDTTITIDGGTLTSNTAAAIYHPQDGNLTITGGTISGYNGIEMKAGNLSVTGGTILGTGAYLDPLPNDDGSANTGDAILLNGRNAYTGDITVTISNTATTTPIITSSYGYALREYVGAGQTLKTSAVLISGGEFRGGTGKQAVTFSAAFVELDRTATTGLMLTGGLYNTDPADPDVYVFVPYGTILDGSMFRIVGISLDVHDFYYNNNGILRGVSTDFYANNFLFSSATSVEVRLYAGEDGSYVLQQTNVLKLPTTAAGVLTSSFDYFGTYVSNSWTNTEASTFDITAVPTHVEVTVVLPGGTLDGFKDLPTGDRASILPGVNGLVTLQGILAPRADVPIYLTSGLLERDTTSTAMTDINYWFTGVETLTYTFTTNQARYLNLTAASGKTFLVDRDLNLTDLRLYGGDVDQNNNIQVNDASLVGTDWGSTLNPEANINYDGIVNIQDLALVGGNFGLTSATAYDWWSPLP